MEYPFYSTMSCAQEIVKTHIKNLTQYLMQNL